MMMSSIEAGATLVRFINAWTATMPKSSERTSAKNPGFFLLALPKGVRTKSTSTASLNSAITQPSDFLSIGKLFFSTSLAFEHRLALLQESDCCLLEVFGVQEYGLRFLLALHLFYDVFLFHRLV